MPVLVLLLASVFVGDVREYSRPLDAKRLESAAFEAEVYGVKKSVKPTDQGLQVLVSPGDAETGWKTPSSLKIGGDFTITATFLVRKLPKPAQDDGSAVGLAIANQNLDQPDAALIRAIEPKGDDVYRAVEKGNNAARAGMPQQPQNIVMVGRPGAANQKPSRKTFPAKGETVVMEMKREGSSVFYSVVDAESDLPRYLGQVALGTGDVTGVKLFASNRNGGDGLEVVFRSLMVRADRIVGLGTEIRTVSGDVLHGEPIGIEDGKLLIGAAVPGTGNSESPANANEGAPPEAAEVEPGEDEDEEMMMELAVAAPVQVATAVTPVAVTPPAKKDEPAKPSDPSTKQTTPAAKPEPKAKVALDELDVITFEKALSLSARFVGQPNLDYTSPGLKEDKEGDQKIDTKSDDVLAPPPGTIAPKKIPKVEPKLNGIRDLQLTLSGLRNVAIQQVTVSGQTNKGQASWRIDTSNSRDWPLVVQRAGTESWADLFLEPPEGDLKGKALNINVTYTDGQSGSATAKVEVTTDAKLTFDAKASVSSFDARVYLTGGEQLFGKFVELTGESLRVGMPWGDNLEIPLAHVIGIYMGLPQHNETAESFTKRLQNRGAEDLLLVRSNDGELVAVNGVAEGSQGEKLSFQFQEKTRTVSLKQVEGLVLAARPEPERPKGPRSTFSLAGGLLISGSWEAADAKSWKLKTDWGQELNLPSPDVRSVRFQGGRMTYLSDLEPVRVEETPYFTRRNPWRKDVNLLGELLKMDGSVFDRGLAVHSRTVLTYDLSNGYDSFETLVGFDDSSRKLGRVDCRVLADDVEIFSNPDLRANEPPVKLSLPVKGVKRLKLSVDFGADQNIGDRVIWANARLLRDTLDTAEKTVKPK